MRKVALVFALIVLAGVAAAWYFIAFRLDGVVESEIERAATLSMGTAVEVGGVRTNLRDGSVTVQQISVANPPGFDGPYAARFKGVEAQVDYDTREVKRVVIDNPEFFIEEAGGKTNFGELLDTLEKQIAAGETEGQTAEPEIVIRHFRINQTRAAFESRTLDRVDDVGVDAIEMNDLRGTPSELATLIAREVVQELSSEAANEMLKSQARKKFGEVEEKLSSGLRDLFGSGDQPDDETGSSEQPEQQE